MRHIRINQIGYLTNATKYAVFADLQEDDRAFKAVNVQTGDTVYQGEITEAVEATVSGEKNSVGYFSEVKAPGVYKLVTSKGQESYEFMVGDNIFDDVFLKVFRVLYLQRCGVELPENLAGAYAHPACHTQKTLIYGTDRQIDVTGGWHDAGDYGRYIVSGVKTIMDLFLAYQANEAMFTDSMNIPESGNGIPDILDEARFELEWMFKMQDQVTGGVYHKVTGYSFPGFVMPQFEDWDLVVSPISNAATGDFVAIMALASTIYKDIDQNFADKCIEAAIKAYQYLEAHETDPGFKNPKGVVTGEYPDDNCYDEIMWAAVELYKVTGQEKYFDMAKKASEKVSKWTILGWDDMGGYAAFSTITSDLFAKNHPDFTATIRDKFMGQVEDMLAESVSNPYFISRSDTFEWGSNMSLADNGMIFWMANKIEPKEEYIKYAEANLNYLFGINAVDYCFVTGAGSNSPVNPHHRPSGATGSPMPGMLVGGPDNGMHDPTAEKYLAGKAPAKCYIDHVDSYSTNEICVYWNSPLIALMAMLL